MDNSEETTSIDCEMPQQQSLPIDNNSPSANDITDSLKNVDQNSNSENQTSDDTTDGSSQNVTVASETSSVVAPTDNSMPPLPPLPKDDKELPQPPAPYSADYNMQNYANYNYNMYNYNNFYGYPYPQYQWDYNSQQYYQPYQNYYNYNYNASQSETSKPPLPPSDAVQLPVEEKPSNKANATNVDESNRYSPTAEPDDDDATKGLSENSKSDVFITPPHTTTPLTNSVPFQNVSSEQIEIPQNITETIENKTQQPVVPLITQVQQPVIAQIQPYNITPVQQPTYLISPQIKTQPTEAELKTQQQNSPTLNGKDDTVEKVSKASTVLGKHQAKKRLMAFSMMKQKLQEQSNSINDNQGSDVGEGNDVEFIPELNVFQTATKKKVVTNKKVIKVIKAQQTIEQIEEMKKDELMQGNNAALYQHLLRSGGNEAPILQKLGIESLAEKYSAKIREQDKRLKRHHHKHRDDRRGHKYRRRSHSKSRSRSRSKSAEKPKMRALEVKSWKDFVSGGFHFDKFRRFKLDEAEEIKEKERKSRSKKRHRDSRSDGKNQNTESITPTETEKGNGEHNLRYNLLDRKKEILKGLEVVTHEGDCTKDFPSYLIQHTKSKPVVKYSQNPAKATCHLQNRQQMLATLLPEIEAIVHKFFSSMKPKRLKENPVENYNCVDDQLSVIMKDKNIYPFKGWWPKQSFIVTQVKEDPNVEIDRDALVNEFTTSKRTKKSRFNDDTSVDLRPTVPSKWDSDYDGSPAADKPMDVEVPQNFEMNTSDVCVISREENNIPDINHQEKAMDIGEEKPKIDINVCQVVPTTYQEPQEHAKLDTEYEKFLKIVSAEKANEKDEMLTIAVQKENESNLSINLAPLNDESVHDEESENDDTSTKSSDESVSLHNTAEESVDRLFVKSSSSIDKKYKKKKKTSGKKAKKLKKKESKKKKYKSSSSESSQDSESEDSDSSSDDESESTDDSSSSIEEKSKKKKIKDGKKKKSKANYKKKHKGDKNKSKKLENEKDNNSSILNLLEKAFNVEIKKRPTESDESKQKKKKRKHEKKEKKSIEDNDDEFEKVKECLKETFTKLVKTDKAKKNQSLSCDDTAVSEVLKYLKMDKEKFKKKSKKSSKRKCDSDNSDDEKSIKRSRLDECLKLDDSEKKKKKKKKSSRKGSVDSEERVLKKKCKKKSKTTDTSDTDDEVGLKYKKSKKEKNSENFFGQRPNEWNVKNKSSMRGVVHHSADKNINFASTNNIGIDDVKVEKSKCKKLNLSGKMSCSSDTEKNKSKKPVLSDILRKQHGKDKKIEKSDTCDENIKEIESDVLKNVAEGRVQINLNNSGYECVKEKECNFEDDKMFDKSDQCDNNEVKHKNNLVPQSAAIKDNNNGQIVDKDINSVLKPTLNKSLDQSDKCVVPTNITPIVPLQQPVSISYRDKVKMNLKKLSTCQNTPFIFGFSLPLNVNKLHSLKKENIKEDFQVLDEKIKTPEEDESQLLNVDCRPKVVICPQTQKKKSNTTQMMVPPKIDMEANNDVLDQNFNLDNSEKSCSDDSSVVSANTLEYASDEEDNEQVNPSLFENDLSSINDENQKYKNEILSNSSNLKEQLTHSFDITETNRSSDFENEKIEVSLKVESNFADEETTTTFSNSADIQSEQHEQHFESSTAAMCQQHHNEPSKVFSPRRKDPDSICSQQTTIDIEVTNIELINKWISDWSMLDKCVGETNNAVNCRTDNSCEFQMKKKSRWDKQSKNNITNESQQVFDGQEKVRDKMSDHTTDELKTTSAQSDLDIFLERQNQQDAFISNYENDSTDYDYYIRNWSNEYSEYGQDYSCEPRYSEMKTIEYDQLGPVDYSIYENYNPNYDYNGENYENWKSLDTSSNQLATDEMSMQVGNVLEILPSENIVTIVPDIQDEKLISENRKKQFFQLYQQYFQHYNQNPFKYSKSNPVLSNTTKFCSDGLDTLPPQENSDGDAENKPVLIPLQDRAYERILEDQNTILYMTNDNYIAYCAIEDKCMVHIAFESINRDGIDDKVRHCFNINQNGTVVEYWLNADLIPFHGSSDSESEVFSDDEVCSEISNSVGEEDNLDNNNGVDDTVEGDWELVDSDGEDKDDWLKEPHVLEKYGGLSVGIGQTIAEANQGYTNSSEYDTDTSDFCDSNIEISERKKQNVTVNPFHMSFVKTEDDKNNSQNVVDVNATIDVKQIENISENLESKVETNDNVTLSDQLVLNPETEHVNEDLPSKIINENVSTEFEGKEKDKENVIKPEIPFKAGTIAIDDLTMMNVIIKQKMLIQRLQILGKKKKSPEELSDTPLAVCCNDNMESVKHPFLGLFQPPTISILSKERSGIKVDKRVTFADGIGPSGSLAVSSTYYDKIRPLSPPPLKALMRETLDLKRKKYPFMVMKRVRRITKLTMKKKKVAMVNPLVKSTESSSNIKYYIGKRCSEDSNKVKMAVGVVKSDDSSNSENISSPGLIDSTPVPSDNDCWNDDENVRER